MTDTPSDDQALHAELGSLLDESAGATPAYSIDPTRPPPNLFDLPVQNAIESVEKTSWLEEDIKRDEATMKDPNHKGLIGGLLDHVGLGYKPLSTKAADLADRQAAVDSRRQGLEDDKTSTLGQVFGAINRNLPALPGQIDLRQQFKADMDREQKVLDRARADSQRPLETWGVNFAESTIQGATSFASSLAKGIGDGVAVARWGVGYDDKIDTNTLQAAGKWLETKGKLYFPGDPARQEDFSTKLGQGIGSVIGFYGANALGKLAGQSDVMRMWLVGALGALSTSSETFDDAIKSRADGREVSDHALATAYVGGLLIGASESLPIVASLNWPFKSKSMLGAYLMAASREGFEESLQESFQSFAQNFVANTLAGHDPSRGMFDGISDAALIGFLTGGGSQALQLSASRGARYEALEKGWAPFSLFVSPAEAKPGAKTDPRAPGGASPAPGQPGPAPATGAAPPEPEEPGFNVVPDTSYPAPMERPEFSTDVAGSAQPINPAQPQDPSIPSFADLVGPDKSQRKVVKDVAEQLTGKREWNRLTPDEKLAVAAQLGYTPPPPAPPPLSWQTDIIPHLPRDDQGYPDRAAFQQIAVALTGKDTWNRMSPQEQAAVATALQTGGQPVNQPANVAAPTPAQAQPARADQAANNPDIQPDNLPTATSQPASDPRVAEVEKTRRMAEGQAALERLRESLDEGPDGSLTLKSVPAFSDVDLGLSALKAQQAILNNQAQTIEVSLSSRPTPKKRMALENERRAVLNELDDLERTIGALETARQEMLDNQLDLFDPALDEARQLHAARTPAADWPEAARQAGQRAGLVRIDSEGTPRLSMGEQSLPPVDPTKITESRRAELADLARDSLGTLRPGRFGETLAEGDPIGIRRFVDNLNVHPDDELKAAYGGVARLERARNRAQLLARIVQGQLAFDLASQNEDSKLSNAARDLIEQTVEDALAGKPISETVQTVAVDTAVTAVVDQVRAVARHVDADAVELVQQVAGPLLAQIPAPIADQVPGVDGAIDTPAEASAALEVVANTVRRLSKNDGVHAPEKTIEEIVEGTNPRQMTREAFITELTASTADIGPDVALPDGRKYRIEFKPKIHTYVFSVSQDGVRMTKGPAGPRRAAQWGRMEAAANAADDADLVPTPKAYVPRDGWRDNLFKLREYAAALGLSRPNVATAGEELQALRQAIDARVGGQPTATPTADAAPVSAPVPVPAEPVVAAPENPMLTALRSYGISDADITRAGGPAILSPSPISSDLLAAFEDVDVSLEMDVEGDDGTTASTPVTMPAAQALTLVDRRLKGLSALMRCLAA